MTSPATPTVMPEAAATALPPPRSSWFTRAGLVFFLAALFLPPFLADPDYRLPQFNKYAALALLALGVDLIWGYTGLLSLGQGVYFGLGAYAMGYCLALQRAAMKEHLPLIASPDMALPDFMSVMGRLPAVPFWCRPFINPWCALAIAMLLPMLLAGLFGLTVFRLRIKGVYFSLLTQALLLAVYMIVIDQLPYTGGVVGMTYLAPLKLFGQDFEKTVPMYFLILGVLLFSLLLSGLLVRSKFGRILTAIRDNENRVLALGYDTAMYKTFIFAIAGGLAGVSGALYVAAQQTAGPDYLQIDFSIIAVILVAVGGRGTLIGAILGTFLVRFGETYINELTSDKWPIILGGSFVVVVLFLPEGFVGLFRKSDRWLKRLRPGA